MTVGNGGPGGGVAFTVTERFVFGITVTFVGGPGTGTTSCGSG